MREYQNLRIALLASLFKRGWGDFSSRQPRTVVADGRTGAITLTGCFAIASASVLSAIAFSGSRAFAQITPDDTLGGERSDVGADNIIHGGAQRGANLFHSFSEFNVGEGLRVDFSNPTGIENILSRVTGSNPSNIFGTLGVLGDANLFLLNPNGIVFGPNARLDLQGGSFVGTTASAIGFPNGGVFSVTSTVDPNNALLTVNPSALFPNQPSFKLGSKKDSVRGPGRVPGAIINQSTVGLEVNPGQSLFLVGGEVRLENGGTIRAPGGRIELGGLVEAGKIKIEDSTPDGSNPNLFFPNVGLTFPEIPVAETTPSRNTKRGSDSSLQVPDVARANVLLTNGAIVDVTGQDDGDIAINANNVELLGDSNICAGIGFNPDCNGRAGLFGGSLDSEAGNIIIDATGEVKLSQSSRIANNVNANATGNQSSDIFEAVSQAIATGDSSVIFGSIFISAESLSITGGASVSTSTFGNGNAGLVYVEAKDSVFISGFLPIPGGNERSRLASAVGEGATGNAGGIFIQTDSFSMTDFSAINSSTSGVGSAGAVIIEAEGAVSFASDAVIFNNVEAGGNGAGGVIDIEAESLSITGGAQLQTLVRGGAGGLPAGQGNAGEVTIDVRDTVTISGVNNQGFPSAIFSSVQAGATGNAGNIQISTQSLSLSNFGRIDTSLRGVGTAGSIFIEATDSVSLTTKAEIETVIEQGGRESRGASSPFAGNIIDILLGRGGDVTGTIFISTGTLSLKDGAVLNTSTLGDGNAGAVVVLAEDAVSLKGGAIGSLVGDGATGNAGAILMSVGSLSIASTSNHGSGLTTETLGGGDAGLIYVEADKDISIRGDESGNESVIASRVEEGSANTSGAIILEARSLFLRGEGAKVTVNNQGSGLAGDIEIIMREDIILRDQGEISAIAASGQGGNIELVPGDFLLLLDESGITTNAFNLNNPNGNGGNIDILTTYVIAAPFNTNDIIAKAVEGVGGRIDIRAGRIFDIEERTEVFPTNDIDASSDFGLDGIVSANDLNIDPTQGFTNLPANLIDPSTLIAETCAPRSSIAERQNNKFINTRQGGLPPDPNAAFPGEAVVNDLDVPEETEESGTGEPQSANPALPTPVKIASSQEPTLVEAQGWVYGDNGTVIFTAQAPSVTPNSSALTPASTCHDVSASLQPK